MPTFGSKKTCSTIALIALAAAFTSYPGYSAEKLPWVGKTLEGNECKGNWVGFGPFDYRYRDQFPNELEVVEHAHFTREVERLESGSTSVAINDIAYTIGAWPNHHRALHSAVRFRMMNWEWPKDAGVPPAECQLQRAILFSPDDPIPYMMYGLLLHKSKQYDAAIKSYREANRLRPDDALTLYNMGLTLVELQQYDEAVQAAKTAYAAGIPLPGLKNKLIEAGQWEGAPKATDADKTAPKVVVQPAEATEQDEVGDDATAESEDKAADTDASSQTSTPPDKAPDDTAETPQAAMPADGKSVDTAESPQASKPAGNKRVDAPVAGQ